MDFLKANYHTHTTRCHHAIGTEREYIETAIEMGIEKLGFSDHVPCPFQKDYVSFIRMPMEQAEEYVDTIRTLQREYEKDIQIFAGFEAEYIPEFFPEQLAQWKRLQIDYVIMGEHFLGPENKSPYTGGGSWDRNFLKAYVDTIIEGFETGVFTYLAHPDLFLYRGLPIHYEQEMRRLCRYMKETGRPMEMNLLGMSEGKHYPNPKFWKVAGEEGVKAIMALDAHFLSNLKNTECYGKARKLLDKYGVELAEDVQLAPIR